MRVIILLRVARALVVSPYRVVLPMRLCFLVATILLVLALVPMILVVKHVVSWGSSLLRVVPSVSIPILRDLTMVLIAVWCLPAIPAAISVLRRIRTPPVSRLVLAVICIVLLLILRQVILISLYSKIVFLLIATQSRVMPMRGTEVFTLVLVVSSSLS